MTSGADPNVNPNANDWRAALPEALRADEALKGVKDVSELATGYLEASKKAAGALTVPSEDAPPEKWEEFYRALGRPEKADKYELPDVNLPEGVEMSDGIKKDVADIRGLAFTLGLSAKQAKGLLGWYETSLVDVHTAAKKTVDEGLKNLKAEWNTKYDEKVAVANRVALKTGGQELLDVLAAAGLTQHPLVIKFFEKISAPFLEDATPEGEKRLGAPGANDQTHAQMLYGKT